MCPRNEKVGVFRLEKKKQIDIHPTNICKRDNP